MRLCIPSIKGGPESYPPGFTKDDVHVYDNARAKLGVVPSMHQLYRFVAYRSEILAFMHDDVTIHEEGWIARVEAEFKDPKVAIVGLGGATGLGLPDIYKTRYSINQLQRVDYFSNQRDWEVHGQHETGARDVAVVDGFFMAVRTSFLKEIDGWSGFPHNFHMYDAYLCLMAARNGYKVRIVGVDCTHHGGGTSTKVEYAEWCKEHGTTMEREHQEPHVFIYEQFRDSLPLRVG